MNKQVVQPYLTASNSQQKIVLDYLRQRCGKDFTKTLCLLIWELLVERYLIDALYTQNAPISEIEYEGKRIIAILSGEQVKIKELLETSKPLGVSSSNNQPSLNLINSLERLLSTSSTVNQPVSEPQSELKAKSFESAPEHNKHNDDSLKDEASLQHSIAQQQEVEEECKSDRQSKFDLKQFAEDAYQIRLQQIGQLPEPKSDTDSDERN